MNNNVVSAVFDLFVNNNISCLRFNFRAVGRSTGSHSSGRGELSDVKACVDFLINKKKIDQIFICGYSYGAAIGCSMVEYSPKIIGYAAISFPWDFMGKKYKKLSNSKKPKLFVQGDRDNVANYGRLMDHYASYNVPKEYRIVKGADHFWWGLESLAAEEVYRFYESLMNT
jgi:hypothetical protein